MTKPKARKSVNERPYGGQDHAVRVDERRQRLVETGLKLFSTQGYKATTVRSVIAHSGMATRYFYESFGSTEELFITCYRYLVDAHLEEIRTVASAPHHDFEAFAAEVTRRFFNKIEDPTFMRITQIEVFGISDEVDQVYIDAIKKFSDLFGMTMSHYLHSAKCQLDEDDWHILGYNMTMTICTSAVGWVRGGFRYPKNRVVELTLLTLFGTYDQIQRQALQKL